jgi:hypothetical protein
MDDQRRSPEKEDVHLPVATSFDSNDRGPHIMEVSPVAETRWQYLRRYFTTREGWIGDYV